jgi:hypothetical protein
MSNKNKLEELNMLKVNDIVRVREDLQVGVWGNNTVVDQMLNYRGDYGYIVDVTDRGHITCDFDSEIWSWNKEMLELVPGFKMGGKVLIKNDLKVDATYGDVDVVVEMSVYFGKEATIKDIDHDGDVYLDIDEETYVWSLDMLIPLEEAIDPIDYKEEYARLVEDVNEYEGIIASLEEDLQQARKDNYNLIREYNVLVDKYNSLLNELMEEYIPIYK